MMDKISITDVRRRLPGYLKQIQAGKALQITSHGKAITRIVPEDDPATAARSELAAIRNHMAIRRTGSSPAPRFETTHR